MAKTLTILGFETSQKSYGIGVLQNNKTLAYRNVKLPKLLNSSLMPSLKKVLDKAYVGLNDIDGFAIGLGPGSFTSLRAGMATVKALALSTNKPVVGVSSLEVLAYNALTQIKSETVCVIVDAKRQMVYSACFKNENGQLKKIGSSVLAPVSDVVKFFKGDVLFIGDGIGLYKKEIIQAAKTKFKPLWAKENLWYPKVSNLLKLAHARFLKKDVDDIVTLVPEYLYADDCQVSKK